MRVGNDRVCNRNWHSAVYFAYDGDRARRRAELTVFKQRELINDKKSINGQSKRTNRQGRLSSYSSSVTSTAPGHESSDQPEGQLYSHFQYSN